MDDVELVLDVVGELRVGKARSQAGLALVSIWGDGHDEPGYFVAADAVADGTLAISEATAAAVDQLLLRNDGDRPVLLIDGEHLEGARQNRVLNISLLAAAKTETLIPVSCVEQARWSYRRGHHLTLAPEIAHSGLRGGTALTHSDLLRAHYGHRSDQAAVWAEIERKRGEVGARASPTRAMRDVFADRRSALSTITDAFRSPEPGQVGVAACVDGRPIVADVFGHPLILARLWGRLVHGYAMDALGHPPADIDTAAVESMLKVFELGETTVHDDLGAGTNAIATAPGVVANALTWQGSLVHLAVFAVDDPGLRRHSPARENSPDAERRLATDSLDSIRSLLEREERRRSPGQ